MLVCHVSQGARRAVIAADIAEAAAASDTATHGHVVFAALVDDPANVLDRVDAYLGEIMLEAASAASTVNAALGYAVVVSEAATATETLSSLVALTVSETASAASAQDGTVVAAAPSRSAMVAGPVFVNPGTSREAHVTEVMVNL